MASKYLPCFVFWTTEEAVIFAFCSTRIDTDGVVLSLHYYSFLPAYVCILSCIGLSMMLYHVTELYVLVLGINSMYMSMRVHFVSKVNACRVMYNTHRSSIFLFQAIDAFNLPVLYQVLFMPPLTVCCCCCCYRIPTGSHDGSARRPCARTHADDHDLSWTAVYGGCRRGLRGGAASFRLVDRL